MVAENTMSQSLEESLQRVDQIEDDELFMEEELDAVRTYYHAHQGNLTEEERAIIEGRGLVDYLCDCFFEKQTEEKEVYTTS